MRKPLIAGNWKMNLNKVDAISLVSSMIKANIDYSKVDVLIAPSFTNISPVETELSSHSSNIILGAQNVSQYNDGAYTGEISADMLLSVGVKSVIIGHSERRSIFNESDEVINAKVINTLSKGLNVILCVGEQLSERESGVASEVVISQLVKSLKDVKVDSTSLVIAYEPVWAIGTGKTASKEDAEEMHKNIREFLKKQYGSDIANKVRILYGGSVKPDNISDLMLQPNIDGALVGGASLKIEQFIKIINY